MSVKEMVMEQIREMPDDASPEDIQEKLHFILGVRQAMNSMDKGHGSSKDAVKAKIPQWAGR